MQWKRHTIRTTVWQAESADFRITEDPEAPHAGKQYRLDSPIADPEFFSTLDDAKANAVLKNDLMLARDECERLRTELDQKNGRWPPGLTQEEMDSAAEQHERDLAEEARGIPHMRIGPPDLAPDGVTPVAKVDEIAGQLVGVMADHSNGKVMAGEKEIPF